MQHRVKLLHCKSQGHHLVSLNYTFYWFRCQFRRITAWASIDIWKRRHRERCKDAQSAQNSRANHDFDTCNGQNTHAGRFTKLDPFTAVYCSELRGCTDLWGLMPFRSALLGYELCYTNSSALNTHTHNPPQLQQCLIEEDNEILGCISTFELIQHGLRCPVSSTVQCVIAAYWPRVSLWAWTVLSMIFRFTLTQVRSSTLLFEGALWKTPQD